MFIKLEKRILRNIEEQGTLPLELTGLYFDRMVEIRRIEPKDDVVTISTEKNKLIIEHKNIQNFNWKFEDSTFSDLRRIYSKLKIIDLGENRKLIFEFRHKLRYVRKVVIDLNELFGGDKFSYEKSFDNSRCWAEKLFRHDSGVQYVLFETLLNICQHEYRVHDSIEINELARTYDRVYILAKLDFNSRTLYIDNNANDHQKKFYREYASKTGEYTEIFVDDIRKITIEYSEVNR